MKEYKTIIWDFNGTIIDDVRAAMGAVNDMLILRNQQTINLQQYREAVDTPIWKFYETVFEKNTITQEQAISEFDTGVDKHLQEKPLMKGAKEILLYFASRGKRQIIVSSSHIDKVLKQLDSLGVSHFFDKVLALSDYYAGNKTHLAREYIGSNHLDSQETLVIGDTVADFNMASELGCDCILNTAGHQCSDALINTGAVVIDSLSELKSIIK